MAASARPGSEPFARAAPRLPLRLPDSRAARGPDPADDCAVAREPHPCIHSECHVTIRSGGRPRNRRTSSAVGRSKSLVAFGSIPPRFLLQPLLLLTGALFPAAAWPSDIAGDAAVGVLLFGFIVVVLCDHASGTVTIGVPTDRTSISSRYSGPPGQSVAPENPHQTSDESSSGEVNVFPNVPQTVCSNQGS